MEVVYFVGIGPLWSQKCAAVLLLGLLLKHCLSVGKDNSYGHPNREVLERFTGYRAAVFRTDEDGLIAIRSDGRRLELDTNRWRRRAPQLLGIF